uniref:ShKT domain-containing protein n=1 Tax=Rhabditophanes sp. KR3021 TaxID=114890 RepID=A0AC35U264_9BILA
MQFSTAVFVLTTVYSLIQLGEGQATTTTTTLKPLTTTLSSGTTTASLTCTDVAANCANIAAYCQNPNYSATMMINCKKTCFKCVLPAAPSTACKNLSSNCNAALCGNPLWEGIMATNCKSTCNKC